MINTANTQLCPEDGCDDATCCTTCDHNDGKITDEITQHGQPIDKVRAGYILEERLALSNEVIDSWAQYAQRGGSRKLDATAEYIPQWSDKWCLSINTFE